MTKTIFFDARAVSRLIAQVADSVILPNFGKLAAADIGYKSPGAVVTPIDRAAEAAFAAGLAAIFPAPVVGEESVSEQPALLNHLDDGAPVWIVDPLDGTANYAAGRTAFGVLIALCVDRRPIWGWVADPLGQRLVEAGPDGVRLNDRPLPALSVGAEVGAMTPWLFKPPLRTPAETLAQGLAQRIEHRCVAHDYLSLAEGRAGFALYGRINPWDHAAGAAVVTAMGGRVGWLDGTEYAAIRTDQRGLLLAASDDIWQSVHDRLFPPADRLL